MTYHEEKSHKLSELKERVFRRVSRWYSRNAEILRAIATTYTRMKSTLSDDILMMPSNCAK